MSQLIILASCLTFSCRSTRGWWGKFIKLLAQTTQPRKRVWNENSVINGKLRRLYVIFGVMWGEEIIAVWFTKDGSNVTIESSRARQTLKFNYFYLRSAVNSFQFLLHANDTQQWREKFPFMIFSLPLLSDKKRNTYLIKIFCSKNKHGEQINTAELRRQQIKSAQSFPSYSRLASSSWEKLIESKTFYCHFKSKVNREVLRKIYLT